MATSTIETTQWNYDGLIAGSQDIETRAFTLVTGQKVVRGQVLGLVSASGKLATYSSAASNGTQTAYAIAAEDKDATSADAPILAYLAGDFNVGALTFSHTGDSATQAVFDALRTLGIYLKTNQAAVDN